MLSQLQTSVKELCFRYKRLPLNMMSVRLFKACVELKPSKHAAHNVNK